MIYHITEKQTWGDAKTQGQYSIDSLKTDGFIHFSTKEQVVDVANYLYKGKRDLVLLCVDENKTTHKVVFEDLKGHGIFPHLYGPLNLDAVLRVVNFPVGTDGIFVLPKNLA